MAFVFHAFIYDTRTGYRQVSIGRYRSS
jgi:hypothetical protein